MKSKDLQKVVFCNECSKENGLLSILMLFPLIIIRSDLVFFPKDSS